MACAGSPALAHDTNSPYGVVAFIPSPTRFDAMQEANINWGRYDFSWRSVEATGKGAYNWGVQDYAVAEANARGLQIYAGLGYTPAWASTGGNANSRPTNLQDWYDYVHAAVSRYKGSIQYWEMWNEPNLTQFWNGTRAQYIELLKVGADAAHAADPDCMVVAPDLSSAGPASTWMTDILQQAGNKIDVISFHQYDGGDIPSGRLAAMDAMHNTIVNLGYGNKPVWITESGFRSDATGMTEQKQAEYLTATLAGVAARPWIKKFFWYQLWEGGAGEEKWGLLRQDESRKPSWQAYHDYAAAHPAPEIVSVNLSDTDITKGVNPITVGDGHTTPDTKAGRRARRNTDAAGGDYYMYFDVADDFAFQGNRPVVAIDVDYYDLGTGTLTLEYDSNGDGEYKTAGSVALGNKDTWKQFTFHLDDAYFGNRQNNGADFRISAGVATTFYLDVVQVNAAPMTLDPNVGSWRVNTDGRWQTGSNWHTGVAPNAIGAKATLGDVITTGRVVFTSAPVTLGTLNFNDTSTYLLTGHGSLTMQVSADSAQINVTQGTHKINLPMIIASNTVMNIASGTLLIADPVTINAGRSLTKIGAGAVTYRSTVTVLGGGSLQVQGLAQVGELLLADDARADVNGTLIVQGADHDTMESQVRHGFNGGDWQGHGITSSAAADDPYQATTLGLMESGGDVLVKYTYYGDADLSGTVDLIDFDHYLDGYTSAQGNWSAGDFDLSGSVNLADFGLYLHGFKHQDAPLVTPELLAALGEFASTQGLDVDLTSLPEPSAIAVMTLAAGGLLRRRRRIS